MTTRTIVLGLGLGLGLGLATVAHTRAQEKEDPLRERLDQKRVGKRYRIKVVSAGVPTLGAYLEGYSCRTTYRVLDKDGKLQGTGYLNDHVYVEGPGDYAIEVHGKRVTETFVVPEEMTPDRVQQSWRRARAVELRPKGGSGRLTVPSIWVLHPPQVVGEHNDDYRIWDESGEKHVEAARGVAVVYPPEEIHDIDGGVLFENTLVHLWPGLYMLEINQTAHLFELKAGEARLVRLGALVAHEVKKEIVQRTPPLKAEGPPAPGMKTGGEFKLASPPLGKFFVVCPGTYEDGDEKVEIAAGGAAALHGVKRPFGEKPRLGVKATDAGSGEGALVGGFVEGSPAAAAGVKAGDRIVGLDGKEIKTADELVKALEAKKPGDEVELTVRRAGRVDSLAIKVKLGG